MNEVKEIKEKNGIDIGLTIVPNLYLHILNTDLVIPVPIHNISKIRKCGDNSTVSIVDEGIEKILVFTESSKDIKKAIKLAGKLHDSAVDKLKKLLDD